MTTATPVISASAYIAEGAIIRGDVRIGERASIWFNAVVRGDEGPIRIGDETNVQDCCVLHSDIGAAVDIGGRVTIGHGAVVRGACIGDCVMIGMNSTVMSGAVIGEGSIVGAASFVPYRARFPAYSMIYGSPARLIRPLQEWEREQHRIAFEKYLELAAGYRCATWKGPD